jgi:hypothetical protein
VIISFAVLNIFVIATAEPIFLTTQKWWLRCMMGYPMHGTMSQRSEANFCPVVNKTGGANPEANTPNKLESYLGQSPPQQSRQK